MDSVEPTIYELMQRVREHPDYAFGCVFTRNDFPNDELPESAPLGHCEDRLVELGNEMIEIHAPANCHGWDWINPETGKCEHPSHDEEA